jgi:hypothetical protein
LGCCDKRPLRPVGNDEMGHWNERNEHARIDLIHMRVVMVYTGNISTGIKYT